MCNLKEMQYTGCNIISSVIFQCKYYDKNLYIDDELILFLSAVLSHMK